MFVPAIRLVLSSPAVRRRHLSFFSALSLLLCTAITVRAFVNVDFEGYKRWQPLPESPSQRVVLLWFFAAAATLALAIWVLRRMPTLMRWVFSICWITSLIVCLLTTLLWPASYWQTFWGD